MILFQDKISRPHGVALGLLPISLNTLSRVKWEPLLGNLFLQHNWLSANFISLEQNGTQFAAVSASVGPVEKAFEAGALTFSLCMSISSCNEAVF